MYLLIFSGIKCPWFFLFDLFLEARAEILVDFLIYLKDILKLTGFTITIHFFSTFVESWFFRQMTSLIFSIPDPFDFYSFQSFQFTTILRWKAKEKLSFSSEVFLAFWLFSDFFWLKVVESHCWVQQSTAEKSFLSYELDLAQ